MEHFLRVKFFFQTDVSYETISTKPSEFNAHLQVVAAGSSQMAKVATSQGFKSDLMYKVSA